MKHLYVLFMMLCGMSISIAQTNENLDIIKEYLSSNSYQPLDIEEVYVQSSSYSKSMKVTNVYVGQKHKGIPIKNSTGNFVVKDGQVLRFKGRFIQGVTKKSKAANPKLSAAEALTRASTILGLGSATYQQVENKKSNGNHIVAKSNISNDDIPIELVYEFKDDELVLSWDVTILTKDHQHWHSIRIDATNGSLVSENDLMHHCSFDSPTHSHKNKTSPPQSFGFNSEKPTTLLNGSYTVFPLPVESPNHGVRAIRSGDEDLDASPFGWHDTDGIAGAEHTITRGNNVWAAEDRDGANRPGNSPDGGQDLIFDFPFDPDAPFLDYQDASTTNLFYVNNITHDIWYHYGFDEASGNFQENNYGKGGQGSDAVRAFSQDGSDFNNATFGTPAEGSAPVMSMFLWNPEIDPDAQGSFVINNGPLAGDYTVADNVFNPGQVDAPQFPDGITADLVLAIDDDTTDDPDDPNDACSALLNAVDLDGKIAVVRRGSCNFTLKVELCQEAGALAVLVVNNDEDNPTQTINMSGPSDIIQIPAVMINNENGEAIIDLISDTSNTTRATLSDPVANFVFATDGSFDNVIIAHEYGHGISSRLVGGATNVNCLFNDEQMGEGWSDWFGLMMSIEAGDTGTDARGIGTFAVGQSTSGRGIRPFPYSTDMNTNPMTYRYTRNQEQNVNISVPHGVGSVWATILWDMAWAFIERDGYDSDLYNGTGGNNLAMQLVIDGLKLTPCNPGFVDGRDAILDAAALLPNADANTCLIWEVFARRGVGFSATQGDTDDRTDQTEAFDLPPNLPNCQILSVTDVDNQVFFVEPNPSRNGMFRVRVTKEMGNSTISLFDMNGREVFTEKAVLNGVHSLDTRLTSGFYIMKVVAEDSVTSGVFKVIVE